jgi:hypothetical protein
MMPFDLHQRLARDPALESQPVAAFVEEFVAYHREATGTDEMAQSGTVTFRRRERAARRISARAAPNR